MMDPHRCYVIFDHQVIASHHEMSGRWRGPGLTLVILDGPVERHETLAEEPDAFHVYPAGEWHVAGVHSHPDMLCSGEPTTPCPKCGTK